jgi:hypothetical protein
VSSCVGEPAQVQKYIDEKRKTTRQHITITHVVGKGTARTAQNRLNAPQLRLTAMVVVAVFLIQRLAWPCGTLPDSTVASCSIGSSPTRFVTVRSVRLAWARGKVA